MSQGEINTLYNLTILIHEHEWFGERKNPKNREEVQEWVSKNLAICQEIYTVPCGSSWGVLTTKEHFDNYWKEHSKIKD